jgi:hypothetical protein
VRHQGLQNDPVGVQAAGQVHQGRQEVLGEVGESVSSQDSSPVGREGNAQLEQTEEFECAVSRSGDLEETRPRDVLHRGEQPTSS